MTTVCYRDGVLAADSRAVVSEWVFAENVDKVWKLVDGRLVSGTGDFTAIASFVRALRDPGKHTRPVLKDTRVLIVAADGSGIEMHEETGYVVLPGGDNFYAWGAGFPAARAALLMGASAIRAIEVTAMVEVMTGGDVQVVSLNGVE